MSAWDHLPAHLVPASRNGEDSLPALRRVGGVPPVGEVRFSPPPSPASAPSIVALRPAGPAGHELLLVLEGRQLLVPLTWGQLANLNADTAAAIARLGPDLTPSTPREEHPR